MRRFVSGPSPSSAGTNALRRAIAETRRWGGIFQEPELDKVRDELSAPTGLAMRKQGFVAENVDIRKKAYGVPFYITEEQELEEVTKHHHAMVHVHERQRFMMPFWFISVAAAGHFNGTLRVESPHLTLNSHITVRTKPLHFSYPFGEQYRMNQISASYLHDQMYVEQCLCNPETPSMLISRFELLEELQKLPQAPTLIPFVMSTVTACKISKGRMTREVILTKMRSELIKLHGKFSQDNLHIHRCDVFVEKIRPVFLPMTKMMVSTARNSGIKLPVFICGATGRTCGPVLNEPQKRRQRFLMSVVPTAATIMCYSPYVEPLVAISYGVYAGLFSYWIRSFIRRALFDRQMALSDKRLKTTGLLHFSTDQQGWRWTVEEEEKFEYEYREELRHRKHRKIEFEERVREETSREDARKKASFNAAKRQRNDISHPDPLGLYALLGLTGRETSATAKDVSEAFRESARAHHPDLQSGAIAAEGGEGDTADGQDAAKKKMQKILEAYRILKDDKKRKEYDCGLIKAKDLESA